MASFERVCSWVDFDLENRNTDKTTPAIDENTPLSPGEIEIMRNHSKLSSKIYSPSRKSRKSPSFTIHGSTSCTPKLAKSITGGSSGKGSQEKRKTLQVLQPAADGKGILVGSGGALGKQQKKNRKPKVKDVLTQKKLQDFKSSATESSDSDSSSTNHTKSEGNVSDEAFELMMQEPAPERYWQLLAEERRIALHDALDENQKLCKELEELKEKCKKLEEVAGQAEYFASLYSLVMEGEAPSLDESDSDQINNDLKE